MILDTQHTEGTISLYIGIFTVSLPCAVDQELKKTHTHTY